MALAAFGALLALVWVASRTVSSHHLQRQGVVYGTPPEVAWAGVNPFGVNASLEQYADEKALEQVLALVEGAGFHWVRQRFPWAEIEPGRGKFQWERWDRVVAAGQGRGLELIAVLDTTPAWARAAKDAHNVYAPPEMLSWYGDFVAQFAARYAGRIRFIQLWDEPNIYPHWGERDVDPAGYAELLEVGSLAARRADPQAVILAAGLAPNIEPGGANMSDLLYLEGMYEAGARPYFDILAAKPYGLWFKPQDRQASEEVTNFSRAILLREAMERHGDGGKALWAVEFGWNSLPLDWRGQPSIWGWTSEADQAGYTREAVLRAREEWPWMGAMVLYHLQPVAAADDPRWGFALLGPDGSPRPVYWEMKRLIREGPIAYPGRYLADAWCIERGGEWEKLGGKLVSESAGDSLSLEFWGTRLEMALGAELPAGLVLEWDGRKAKPDVCCGMVTVAGQLPLGRHRLKLVNQAGERVEIAGFTIARDPSFGRYWLEVAGLGVAVGIALKLLAEALSRLPLGGWWRWGRERFRAWPRWGELLALAGAVALAVYSSWAPLAVLGLAALSLLLSWRLELGLVLMAFFTPFYLSTRDFGSFPFFILEFLTVVCVLLWVAKLWGRGRPRGWRDAYLWMRSRAKPSGLDLAMGFFLLVATGSLAVSENLGVSLREWRTVVVGPLLFYLLLRSLPLRREDIWALVDALVLAGLVLAGYGLYQYLAGVETIVAEGVRRVRSSYLSPNNLSLFLGRVAPVLLAVAAFGAGKRRRFVYGLSLLPVMLCLYLTFSRGAWLLGLPAALLFLGGMRSRRMLAVMALAVVLGLASLFPALGTERLAGLFDLSQGTGFLRVRLWEASWHMIRDHPLTGVGLDNFLYRYPRYILPGAECEPNLSHPHNLVLDYWTRLGVGGLVALAFLQVAFFRAGLRLYRRLAGDPGLRALTLGLLASMVDFLAHGMIDNSYFLVDLAYVFMLTAGLVAAMERWAPENES